MLLLLTCIAVITGLVVFLLVKPLIGVLLDDATGNDLSRTSTICLIAGICLLVPFVSFGTYYFLGAPGIAELQKYRGVDYGTSYRALKVKIAQAEAQLVAHPNDASNWVELAHAYAVVGRFGAASNAMRSAVRMEPGNIEREIFLGELLVKTAGGVVTSEAHRTFVKVLELDAENIPARSYLALAMFQDGQHREAVAALEKTLIDAEQMQKWHWVSFIRFQLAKLQRK